MSRVDAVALLAAALPSAADARQPPDCDAAQPSANIDDEFWNARPALTQIRAAAYARTVSPDAVLGAVLSRLAVVVPPKVCLPPIVGAEASLNFLVAVLGPSGAGKSTALRVAEELLPIGVPRLVLGQPVGTGEGLIERFLGPKPLREQVADAVQIVIDEGTVLRELTDRRGATLEPTLRSAWSGEALGQLNADPSRRRYLPAMSYRVSVVVAFQPEPAARLLNDPSAGTPQRFVWVHATDPGMPKNPPPWQGQLTVSSLDFGEAARVHFEVDEEVQSEIRQRSLSVQRGELHRSDLDGHADLCRLKVAALLSVLDGRLAVTSTDWCLAGFVMKASDECRTRVLRLNQAEARRRERTGNERTIRQDAARDTAAMERHLLSAARSIGRRVWKVASTEGVHKSVLTRAMSGEQRRYVVPIDAIDLALGKGWIVERTEGLYAPGPERP
jgi:energy-coupling factor transporter ATP-binding protein EcfA2